MTAINQIAEIADVVILTNLMDEHNQSRGVQLRDVGIDAPVYTNQGGKGDALRRIVERYQPSVPFSSTIWRTSMNRLAKHFPMSGVCSLSVNPFYGRA